MRRLERTYRTLLGLAYPESYLLDREEEMIDTLLEVATPDQTRPSLRETLGLVASGLSARAELAGGPDRRRAVMAASTASGAALTFIATLVAVTHLASAPWTNSTPALFIPLWVTFGLVPVVATLVPQHRRIVRPVAATAVAIALVAGPDAVLVPSVAVIGVAWFLLLVCCAPLPLPRRRRPVVAAICVAAGLGLALGRHAINALSSVPYVPRPHDMFALRSVELPNTLLPIAYLALGIICVLVIFAPRIAGAAALLVPPIVLCALALFANEFYFVGDRSSAVSATIVVTALSASLVILSGLRTLRHRAPA